MEKGQIFHSRYQLLEELGGGNSSIVWKAIDTLTNVEVALKIYTGYDDGGLDLFAREYALVSNVKHTNVLSPNHYDTFESQPYLVIPFCKDGSVLKKIGKITEREAWHLIHDVSNGLVCLHGLNPPIIHQDIKPDNILIGEGGNYVITDFGISTNRKKDVKNKDGAKNLKAGTRAYMAPERFGDDPLIIMASDIYSLGATVYELLTGDAPFGDEGGILHQEDSVIEPISGSYSQNLKSVVERCLLFHPWERPLAEQLVEMSKIELDKILQEETATTVHIGRDTEIFTKETKGSKDPNTQKQDDEPIPQATEKNILFKNMLYIIFGVLGLIVGIVLRKILSV